MQRTELRDHTDGSVTQRRYAREGVVTEAMRFVATSEGLEADLVRSEVASGRMIIPANVRHRNLRPIGIGVAARCKVNANIGTSATIADIEGELAKLRAALQCGADTVMDLSTGGNLPEIRQAIIENSTAPVGTVPIYQAAAEVEAAEDLTADLLLRVITEQAEQGVDFMTVHCGLLLEHIPLTANRTTGIVSRGGALLAQWMLHHHRQNPLYECFDHILEIAKHYDVSLSLGDGLRPGCLADASDAAQFAELEVLGELTLRAWEHDVQVMVEGPGHVPFDQIEMNVRKEMAICHGAPFYVLGPLVTDVAAGHDHISSAIGGTMAAFAGAAMLCYVTPKEHLGLPNLEDVKRGVIAHRIAAHAADVARGRPGARDRDDQLSEARFNFDWDKQFELSLDPELARSLHNERLPAEGLRPTEYCSMCGPKFCAMRLTRAAREAEGKGHGDA